MLEFLKAADLSRQFLDLVVEEVKYLQVLQFRYVRRHGCRDGDAEREFKGAHISLSIASAVKPQHCPHTFCGFVTYFDG